MANIDNTILTSYSPKQFDEITKGITFKGERNIERRPGQFFARTSPGAPDEDIKRLSKENPNITFLARYSFESERRNTLYHVDYRAGEEKVVGIEPQYLWPVIEWDEKDVPCYKELINKIKRTFERIDIVVDDPEPQELSYASRYAGGEKIEWCEDEITIVVEHDKYKMLATKTGSQIDEIKCFRVKGIKTVQWEEIECLGPITVSEDDLLSADWLKKDVP